MCDTALSIVYSTGQALVKYCLSFIYQGDFCFLKKEGEIIVLNEQKDVHETSSRKRII